MAISDAPYFAMLKNRLTFLNDRQKILADNVANASTPKFVPKDLDEKAFNQAYSRSFSSLGVGSAGVGNVAPVTLLSLIHI